MSEQEITNSEQARVWTERELEARGLRPELTTAISDETRRALADIDACIRAAAVRASTTFFGG